MKKFWKKTEGFTLVELVVVIAILGILAGVGTVGYSGYVKKANMAADQQLLRDLNTAFAIACIENGVPNTQVTAENINVPSNGEVDDTILEVTITDTVKAAAIEGAFGNYFEGGTFKVMKFLNYNKAQGVFAEADSAFRGLFNTLKEKYSDAIANKILPTNLGAITTEDLFDQLDGAMDMAGNLGLHTLGGEAFVNAYFGYLGVDMPDESASDEELAAAQDALDAKLKALGVDDATAATNAIALYAAQNSAGLTIDRLNNWLGKGNDSDDLQSSTSANTLAEAGALYGMYLSYQQKTNGTVPTGNTLDILNDALSDGDFATWVSTSTDAQAELDAYKTYMEIIHEAGKDDNTRNEILANGFQNEELESLVKELMGK